MNTARSEMVGMDGARADVRRQNGAGQLLGRYAARHRTRGHGIRRRRNLLAWRKRGERTGSIRPHGDLQPTRTTTERTSPEIQRDAEEPVAHPDGGDGRRVDGEGRAAAGDIEERKLHLGRPVIGRAVLHEPALITEGRALAEGGGEAVNPRQCE